MSPLLIHAYNIHLQTIFGKCGAQERSLWKRGLKVHLSLDTCVPQEELEITGCKRLNFTSRWELTPEDREGTLEIVFIFLSSPRDMRTVPRPVQGRINSERIRNQRPKSAPSKIISLKTRDGKSLVTSIILSIFPFSLALSLSFPHVSVIALKISLL